MTDKEVLAKAVEHIENLLEALEGLEEPYYSKNITNIDDAAFFIKWLKSISYDVGN